MNDIEHVPQLMTPTALESQTKAEYDVAIVTAHRFPRSVSQFFQRAESLATATPEIAASMEYAKPVGGGKVKGPSTRLAEIVAATYGNLRVQARIISETATEIVAQGVAHDLETNVAQSTEVAVSILKKDGSRYGADQVATMRAAACSKARRNATFLVVPLALCQPVIVAARKVAAGDAKTLPQRRDASLEWFSAKGIKLSAILDWLGVKAKEDIGLEQMADLIAAQNTAKEEGISLADLFAKPKPEMADNRFTKDPAQQAPSSTITPAQCVEIARKLPDEVALDLLAKYQLHSFGDVKPGDIPALYADLQAEAAKIKQ